ncbi:hypothetical protein C5Y96_18435 [Blastopirellula marina]|uniref:PEP-CTERM protein-sorting domain-containing protein n=1 Tax=Blastopirellula marina TaxID=124 RepID=A0A2S8F5W0_9BACT|nr:hypothetical protein C5Y96_18435 [Blastopirellula marina]RCS48047.1 PEP-CTERM sorting domain-containing protein [Bremerella cremea]
MLPEPSSLGLLSLGMLRGLAAYVWGRFS